MQMYYQRRTTQDTIQMASISAGPVPSRSTGDKVVTPLFRVLINGRPAYHAPSRMACREWLTRHGFVPMR